MATKYLNATETAKLVRAALREAFPDIKFSVRRRVYSGGASVSVRWEDGPNEEQVDSVARIFRGSYFDGSQDLRGSTYAMVDGQTVSFGADYINCSRSVSRKLAERIAARFPDIEGLRITGTDDYGFGFDGGDFEELRPVRAALYRMSDRLRIEKSATAGKVISLGNDGHSEIGALSMQEEQ